MEENKNTNPTSEAEDVETQKVETENVETENVEETVSEEAETIEETVEDVKPSKQDKKKVKKLEAQIEELNKKLSDSDKKLAEYDNYRKRSAKEREGIYTDAYLDAVTEILPILDNMERAYQYKDASSENNNVEKGLEMIMKSFSDTLTKMGVSEIEALGKPFDPNLHNAVMHVDDEQYGENEIVEVFMKGYIKGDKVLRHSMVKVAN